MFRNSATIRISLTLASITLCALFASLALGMFPDRLEAIAAGRAALCESVTVSCSVAAQRGDIQSIQSILEAVTRRKNNDLLSAALRRPDGNLDVVVGNHVQHWPTELDRSTLTQMQVPISVNDEKWGTLELRFKPVPDQNWTLLPTSVIQLISFVVTLALLGHWLYLRRVLQHLDPSNVIPDRVRDTLDSLAEGLLVLDPDERIVLANEAFGQSVGQNPEELQGHLASDLPWSTEGRRDDIHPWQRSIRQGVVDMGKVVKLEGDHIARRVMQVNSAPILDESGEARGVLATFNDVTALEIRNAQLGATLLRLKESRDRISEQNEHLRTLAMIDPLTQCLNRRAFFHEFENQVAAAERKQKSISYIIADVDHFKLVNDNHGHKVGDNVLKEVSELMRSMVAHLGFVCRYGGEEFSILLPESDIDQAADLAELLRARIESTPIANLSITASFGVVQIDHVSESPFEALDRADKALYYCKRSGRNRVSRWDQIPRDIEFRTSTLAKLAGSDASTESQSHIPFTAVSVLLAALQSRDPKTAEHSRRVANLSVEMAAGLMSHERRYVLEVAALLHDVGKLSVPDQILLKPSPLTNEERRMMDTHLRLGERTIKHAFASSDLIEILRTYRRSFAEDELRPDDEIRLAARILQIADAFDAMTSSRPYRDAMSDEEAFEELRRYADLRFDRGLVHRCIEVVLSRSEQTTLTHVEIDTDTALRIGALFERLVVAIDAEDADSLKEIANRLVGIAQQSGSDAIGELADRLAQQLTSEAPWSEVLELSSELVELCRLTQNAYISREIDVNIEYDADVEPLSESYSASNWMPCANGSAVE